jgi:hypothetical protein
MAREFVHVWLPGRGTLCLAYPFDSGSRGMPHNHKIICFFEVRKRHAEITCACCKSLARSATVMV